MMRTNTTVVNSSSLITNESRSGARSLTCILNPFTADPFKALHFAIWSNPPFLIFDIRALWRSVLSAGVPEKIKNGGLDQYGAKPFKQQQDGTSGIEGVNNHPVHLSI